MNGFAYFSLFIPHTDVQIILNTRNNFEKLYQTYAKFIKTSKGSLHPPY